MWLIVIGKQRKQISVLAACQSYRQCFDMEHFLRFGKQRLLDDPIPSTRSQRRGKLEEKVKRIFIA